MEKSSSLYGIRVSARADSTAGAARSFRFAAAVTVRFSRAVSGS
jgi:hypothetical protein